MTRAELKDKAKQQLGRKIFGNAWIMGLLACLVVSLLSGAAGSILPGLGALIVVGPLSYGQCLVFLKQAREGGSIDVGDVFKGFSDDFGGTFLIGLMTGIFTFLWSLLLVVPGIVKAYAYSMAYNIKVDHPDYDWRQCINESKRITNGHKGELFVLDLSFIGWLIVGSLCAGVGTFWVAPYIAAAKANFYENIRLAPAVEG